MRVVFPFEVTAYGTRRIVMVVAEYHPGDKGDRDTAPVAGVCEDGTAKIAEEATSGRTTHDQARWMFEVLNELFPAEMAEAAEAALEDV